MPDGLAVRANDIDRGETLAILGESGSGKSVSASAVMNLIDSPPGYITAGEAAAAKAKPIKLADTAYYQSLPKSTAWDYPVEEIRKYLEEKYTTRVAQGGLKVYSTINVEAQQVATKVIGNAETRATAPIRIAPARSRGSTASAATAATAPAAVSPSQNP